MNIKPESNKYKAERCCSINKQYTIKIIYSCFQNIGRLHPNKLRTWLNTVWKWTSSLFKKMIQGFWCSVLEYTASYWQCWISHSTGLMNINKLVQKLLRLKVQTAFIGGGSGNPRWKDLWNVNWNYWRISIPKNKSNWIIFEFWVRRSSNRETKHENQVGTRQASLVFF